MSCDISCDSRFHLAYKLLKPWIEIQLGILYRGLELKHLLPIYVLFCLLYPRVSSWIIKVSWTASLSKFMNNRSIMNCTPQIIQVLVKYELQASKHQLQASKHFTYLESRIWKSRNLKSAYLKIWNLEIWKSKIWKCWIWKSIWKFWNEDEYWGCIFFVLLRFHAYF